MTSVTSRRLNPRESIFDWNNHASLALQKGSYDEAAFIYTQILARLRAQAMANAGVAHRTRNRVKLRASASASASTRSSRRNGSAVASTDQLSLTLLSVPANSSHKPASAPDGPSGLSGAGALNHFAIYDQAFTTIFRRPEQAQDLNSRRLIAAFAYYNLGLCLHYKEFANKTYKLTELGAAQRSYLKALKILAAYRDPGQTENLLQLVLALYNNLGHLYVHLSDFQQSACCHRRIQHLLALPRLPTVLPMNVRDWNFFQHSLAHFPTAAISPAA
ncbi:expressed unknown protein [Seminavis robusta]|uniref:Uncharacterized protein n=1 Tax=Seminavis robusta TaxID=568900 RepID=A0A9N8H7K4_9STRA|nr:expressed unknown protein [Seminavis robusta]|eukprot:Sro183_g079620.1 n/a (275) ;mRNA; f:29417-30241